MCELRQQDLAWPMECTLGKMSWFQYAKKELGISFEQSCMKCVVKCGEKAIVLNDDQFNTIFLMVRRAVYNCRMLMLDETGDADHKIERGLICPQLEGYYLREYSVTDWFMERLAVVSDCITDRALSAALNNAVIIFRDGAQAAVKFIMLIEALVALRKSGVVYVRPSRSYIKKDAVYAHGSSLSSKVSYVWSTRKRIAKGVLPSHYTYEFEEHGFVYYRVCNVPLINVYKYLDICVTPNFKEIVKTLDFVEVNRVLAPFDQELDLFQRLKNCKEYEKNHTYLEIAFGSAAGIEMKRMLDQIDELSFPHDILPGKTVKEAIVLALHHFDVVYGDVLVMNDDTKKFINSVIANPRYRSLYLDDNGKINIAVDI